MKRIYTILSAIILASILGLVIISLRYHKAFKNTAGLVKHTISVLDETQKTLAVLHNFETATPGAQLAPYLQSLRQLTTDNPIQQARIDSLLIYWAKMSAFGQPTLSRHPTDAKEPSNISRHPTNPAGPATVNNQFPPVYYPDSVRELLLRMQTEEHRLLSLRVTANSSSRKMLGEVIIALFIFIFGLLCTSIAFMLYHLNRRLRAEKRLRESEQQFSLLVRREKNHAIFMVNREGRVISWNEGARQIKGYTEEEALGQHISIFYTEEEIAGDEPARNLQKAAEAGQFESVGWRRRKDGSCFWADVMFTALYDDDGQVTGYIKITRDISQQKAAEEAIRQSLAREKELNEMKSRFVSLASHEFKTPLSVILSSIGLIDKYDGADMADQRRRHVQRIKANVNNLKQILNDFLSLEKLESGVIMNNPTLTDLKKLAADTIADLEESCKEGLQVRLEIVGTPPRPVAVDQHLLRNILNNLLSNAIKYSPTGGLVRFIVQFDPETVSFILIDNGIGIPPEEQQHLFERFFRAHNTTGISGTGLGLSIVKKYLDLMGGSIRVSSQPGEGTTFTAILPAPPLSPGQINTSFTINITAETSAGEPAPADN